MNMDPAVWRNVVQDAAELGWTSLLSLPLVRDSVRIQGLFPAPVPSTPPPPKAPVEVTRFLTSYNQPHSMQWDPALVRERLVALDFGALSWVLKML